MKRLIFLSALALASCNGPTVVSEEEKHRCRIDSVEKHYRYPGIMPEHDWIAYTDCGFPVHFHREPHIGDSVDIVIVKYKNLNQN